MPERVKRGIEGGILEGLILQRLKTHHLLWRV